MSSKTKQILEDVKALSHDELVELMDRLAIVMAESSLVAAPAEWQRELAQRIDDIDAGRVALIPSQEVHRRLREFLRELPAG